MSQVSSANISTDVVVIGGGPAGSTVSTFLAKAGHQVILFEREKFPRFHIGESMIPRSYDVFEKLGLLEKLKSSHFVKKYSVQFANAQGKLSAPFFFKKFRPHESSQTWQVRRSEFDQMLLDHARENGVDAREEHRVIEAIWDGERCAGVRVQNIPTGETFTVHAKVVVDAGGQSSVLMDRLKLREWDPELKKAAVWTYFKNAWRDEDENGGATAVIRNDDKTGWFWYIPLHDNITSVGIVRDYGMLLKNRDTKDIEQIFWQEVARCPGLQPRLEGAEVCDIYRAAKEYSYRAKKAAGDGWVLIGDAFAFLDPLYSSGVLLAVKSGSLASEAISEGLKTGDTSATQLGRWESDYVAGIDRMRRLVCAYYNGLSFGRFLKEVPNSCSHITDLLMGDLFHDGHDETLRQIEAFQQREMPTMGV